MTSCVFYFQVNLIVIRPTAQAIVSLTFGYYIIKPFFPDCEPPSTAVTLMAAMCIGERERERERKGRRGRERERVGGRVSKGGKEEEGEGERGGELQLL